MKKFSPVRVLITAVMHLLLAMLAASSGLIHPACFA
jgi:hypothetical protein